MIVEITGGTVLVDAQDAPLLDQYKWHVNRKSGYAQATIGGKKEYLHRMILGLKTSDGVYVDHRNGDRHDNRRDNLRCCTNSLNMANVGKGERGFGIPGVSWDNSERSWRVHLTKGYKPAVQKRFRWLGEAVKFRNQEAKRLFGEFAKPVDLSLDRPDIAL